MSTVTENCPHDDCEGEVVVELEYEPADNSYGADADGRRGIHVDGYWCAIAADSCTLGHALAADELAAIEQDAAGNAPDPEDEYNGPDGPDDDY